MQAQALSDSPIQGKSPCDFLPSSIIELRPPYPLGHVDTSPNQAHDKKMEPRIPELEQCAEDFRKDLRSLDVRLARVETVTDWIAKNMATKADIAQLESTLLKWFVGTAIAVAGLGFAAAKFLP